MDKASNATVLVDEHLKVKERLAQLQAWHAEWKREDDQLAAAITQLGSIKPPDARKTKAALDALEQRDQNDEMTRLLAGFGRKQSDSAN